MFRVNMNENVTIHKAPERQAVVQGKLSTGRVVGQNPVTAWTPGQMAGASSTSWRAIPPHSEAVHSRAVKRTADFSTEAASARRPNRSEITTQPWQFKEQVNDAVRQLCDERNRNKPDNLSFCLSVVDTYKTLTKHLGSMKDHWKRNIYESCRRHVISEMRALYHENQDEILKFFHDQAAAGRAWIYADKLDKVAQGFNEIEHNACNAENSKVLARIWDLYLSEDLKYLEYLKGFSNVSYSAKRTVTNIGWLTGTWSPSYHLALMSNEKRSEILAQAQSLYKEVICSDVDHSDADKKTEDVIHKATDAMMENRMHHDRLFEQLNKLRSHLNTEKKSEYYIGSTRDCKRIDHLRKSSSLYEEYKRLVNDPDTVLFKELVDLIAPIVNEVQDGLKKGVYDNDRKLKEEALLLVGNLEEESWFGREYKDPHSGCMQSQSTVIPAEQEHEVFHTRLHQLFAMLKNETATIDDYITVLKQIKQLRDDLEGNLGKISEKKLAPIQQRMKQAETMAYAASFAPIIEEYKQYPRSPSCRGVEQKYAAMYCHKDRIIKLSPYTFVLHGHKSLMCWQYAASCAWYHDLERLRHQTSFSEDDVNNLLDLKDAAPNLPLRQIESHLLTTLTNLFRFMLQANPGTALIEKVTKLSEWIDDLDWQHHKISQILQEYNEEWREKYIGKAGERATISSGTSATRMPSSVHPGILGAFPKAFDCHSRTRRQDVPHMQQSSIPLPCPGVPTPTPGGASWRPESSIPCRTPVVQSAAGSRPFPPPWLINRPFLPRIPAPACNRADFRRPPVCGQCGQIQPWASQQQHEPRRSAMPFEEYRSGYSSSSHTW